MTRYLSVLALRFRSLFRKRVVERELQKELELHLDELTAERLAQGLCAEEARLAARRALGRMEQLAEECRDQRRMGFIDRAAQDLKYSIRVLLNHPMFSAIAVGSLTLGIGANTLMFSIVESILLRPLPYRNPAQLLSVTQTSARMPMGVVLPPEFAQWRQESRDFSEWGASNDGEFTLTGTKDATHISAAFINADFFKTLGVKPALGRTFSISEDGSHPERVVILSDQLWKSQFSADRNILGHNIVLNSLGYVVVGVLPTDFRFPDHGQPDLYVPGGFSAPANWNTPRMALLRVIGRIRKDVPLANARRELGVINQQHLMDIPAPYRRAFEGRLIDMTPLHQKLVGDIRPALLVLWGAVGLLLLLTCSNVASLQLARAFARSGEFAIRLALGGDRRRLLQLLLSENLLLAGTGALLGVIGAYALLPVVRTVNALHLAAPGDLRIDPVVLFLALGLTAGSAILFGMGPAISASMLKPNESMKSGANAIAGGAWADRARSGIASIQIALAMILVLAAGFLLKSAANILSNPLGMQPADLATAIFRVDPQRYPDDPRLAAVGEQIIERMKRIPGVQSAGLTNALPFARYSLGAAVVFDDRPAPLPGARPNVPIVAITPDYLRTLEVPVLAGRGIERSDRLNSTRVAVVNQSFVVHFFPHSDPIGKNFRWGADGAPWTEIVGIVADVRHEGQDIDPQPEVYVPFEQVPGSYVGLAIRSALPLTALAPAIRAEFKKVDPTMPVFDIVSMEHRIADTQGQRRIELFVIGSFSILALLLAVTGVYGVINYVVTRRVREFGIKLALGAKPFRVGSEIVRKGVLMAAAGLVPGLVLSYFAAESISSLLYKVKPNELQYYVGTAAVILGAIIASCIFPARRASRTDPARALRWE